MYLKSVSERTSSKIGVTIRCFVANGGNASIRSDLRGIMTYIFGKFILCVAEREDAGPNTHSPSPGVKLRRMHALDFDTL